MGVFNAEVNAARFDKERRDQHLGLMDENRIGMVLPLFIDAIRKLAKLRVAQGEGLPAVGVAVEKADFGQLRVGEDSNGWIAPYVEANIEGILLKAAPEGKVDFAH